MNAVVPFSCDGGGGAHRSDRSGGVGGVAVADSGGGAHLNSRILVG